MSRVPDMIRAASRAKRWLPEGGTDDIARYVRGRLAPDGGFRGRAETADLYYTLFGGGCLLALGRWINPLPTLRYLDAFGEGDGLDFVHTASLIRCRADLPGVGLKKKQTAGLRRLEACRAADGGYHPAGPGRPRGTVYGAYLAFLAYDACGLVPPDAEALVAGLESLRAPDGGYANEPDVATGTTTATAAAILLRQRLAGTRDPRGEAALRACECPAGGFRASVQAPAADLLSTATALYALNETGASAVRTGAHVEFVESLWDDNGGFRGHVADAGTDCEYTFYALLALGCLHDG